MMQMINAKNVTPSIVRAAAMIMAVWILASANFRLTGHALDCRCSDLPAMPYPAPENCYGGPDRHPENQTPETLPSAAIAGNRQGDENGVRAHDAIRRLCFTCCSPVLSDEDEKLLTG